MHARNRNPTSALDAARLGKAVEFMNEHLASNKLDVEHISGAAGLSPFHFSRRFKAATGSAPHVYLTALRISRAKGLLAATCLGIDEIGRRCGFRTHSHFTTMFGRIVGEPPSAFRLRARKQRKD